MLKKVTLLAALCGVCSLSYGQTEKDNVSSSEGRDRLRTLPSREETTERSENPFTFEGSYIGDTYYNAVGGLKRGGGFMGIGNIVVGFDTEKARLWQGGSFFVNGASIHGKSLTENYLGDLQVASNIDAGEHAYLHELWFRQELGRMSFTLGLQDLNAEFMATDGGGEFVSSSFGIPSVMAAGVPVPIFPLTGLGVSVRWDIGDRFAWQAAVFDGCQAPFEHNPHNMRWSFDSDDGVLAATEFHSRFNIGGREGVYKLGAYYHSGLSEFDEEAQARSTVFENNYGFYLMADQSVGGRVSLFGQFAIAPKSKNENDYYIGSGANLSGVFSRQQRDAAGLAVAHAGLHRTGHKHETAVELYYKYQFNDNIALQPDVQYIINPSGGETKLCNALVGMLRLHINF